MKKRKKQQEPQPEKPNNSMPSTLPNDKPLDLSAQPLQRKPMLDGGATEELALRGTVGMLNNPAITGAGLPEGEKAAMRTVLEGISSALPAGCAPPPIPPKRQQAVAKVAPAPVLQPATPAATSVSNKIFLTGKMMSGKDFCASAAGFPVIGFASPIYALAQHFFGVPVSATEGKELPGMRNFLQSVGQIGRGEVSHGCPISMTRAILITMIRSLADANVLPAGIDWQNFGKSKDFWLDELLKVAAPMERVAVSNVRFKNEFKKLQEDNFQHWHVITSTASWTKRLATKNLLPTSPEVSDVSEQLAHQLDASVVKILSSQKTGNKLHVIWSDTAPPPSPRFFTVDQFVEAAKATSGEIESLII